MEQNLSLLQRTSRVQVCAEPFPHLVMENALPGELCDELLASYPDPASLGVDLSENNHRWSVSFSEAREHLTVAPLWRAFLAYHSSAAFLDEILALFGEHLLSLYPARYPDLGSLQALRAGIRGVDTPETAEVLMDAQLSGNTPVQKLSTVRSVHVDKGNKLFSGLFYLRYENDATEGGDLELYRFRPGLSTWRRQQAFNEYSVDPLVTEWVTTVPYRNNTLVLFLNSLESLHGVTMRQPTSRCRLFVNLIGEVNPPLYRYPRRQPGWISPHRLAKQLRRWVHGSSTGTASL